MHKKPYTYTESNQELIKRIELEKRFANYLAKDLMSQRFGITTLLEVAFSSFTSYNSRIFPFEAFCYYCIFIGFSLF